MFEHGLYFPPRCVGDVLERSSNIPCDNSLPTMPIRFFLAWDDLSSSDCDTESQSQNETCDADDGI